MAPTLGDMINTINHEYAFYLGAIVILVLGLYKASQ
jgi:hypothetical protein